MLDHEFRIGSFAGPGFISGRGGEDQIVRDGSGNYWLGQREHMNVYGPGGEFIRTVGREGEGPMEFQYAYPFHADAAGNVHVWDPLNLRVTIISPDYALVDEKPLSGQQINDMIAIDDGSLYVMQTWSSDAASLGQPLHIVDGREVLASFGAEYGPADDPSGFDPLDLRFAVVPARATVSAPLSGSGGDAIRGTSSASVSPANQAKRRGKPTRSQSLSSERAPAAKRHATPAA